MYEQMICPKKVRMKARLCVRLQTKRLTGESHFTLAYIEGWTYGWAVGRSYSDVKTKISRMDGLPYFLSNGAPLKKKKKKNGLQSRNHTRPIHKISFYLFQETDLSLQIPSRHKYSIQKYK